MSELTDRKTPAAGVIMAKAANIASLIAGNLASIGILLITLGLALDVGKRMVTGQGIHGAIDLVGPVLVIIAFLGLAQAERDDEHVALSLIVDRIPFRPRFSLIGGGYALCVALVLWMTFASYGTAVRSVENGEVLAGIVQIPLVPSRIAVVVGLLLLAAQLLITCIDAFRSAVAGEPKGRWHEREIESDVQAVY